MDWLNLHTSILDSNEFLGCDPVERATWLCLLRYCIGQENGGRIEGAVAWGDRKWQQIARVTLSEVSASCLLWRMDGSDVVVWAYPMTKEIEVKKNREDGKKGGRPKGSGSKPNNPPVIPPVTGSETPRGNGKEGKEKGKEEEKEGSHASGQASRLLLNDWTPDSGHSGICAQRNLSMEMQLERFRSQHGATLDTPEGWSRRFYGWIAQGRPEPIFSPAAAMVPPTIEQWTDHAYQFASTHQPFKREDPDYFWPGELARAKWNSHQAAGWARIVDWKAQLEADCEAWNGYERANRKRPAR